MRIKYIVYSYIMYVKSYILPIVYMFLARKRDVVEKALLSHIQHIKYVAYFPSMYVYNENLAYISQFRPK
jgi:hypothetical protein